MPTRRLQLHLPGIAPVTDSAGRVRRPRMAMAVLCLVLFLTFLDNTVVGVALGDIQSHLTAGVSALQWVLNGYLLAFTGLMLSFGTIGDLFGRRKIMAIGIGIFCVGSVLAACAWSPGVLIAGRVVMGVGAAASEPGTLSMIRHVFPDPEDRSNALGAWAAVSGLGITLGPVIGGVLIGLWSWRGVFVFNLFIGALALLGTTELPESADPVRRGIDVPGFVLSAAALIAATTATIGGETAGYFNVHILLLYAIAGVAAIVFVLRERRARHPVLDLRFFRRRDFTAASVVAFTGYFGAFAVFFFIPLYILLVGTSSGFQVALDFIPMAVGAVGASLIAGHWVATNGPRLAMTTGCVLTGGAMLVIDAAIDPSSGPGLLTWSLFLVGVGLGLITVAINAAALSAVPPERSGMAASTVNTCRELGALVGVSVLGAIVNGQLTTGLVHRLQAIGIPKAFQNQVIVGVTTGQVGGGQAQSYEKTSPGLTKIINEVIGQAYGAFGDGLHLVLTVAGIVLLASALLAVTVPNRLRPAEYEPDSGR